MAPPDLRDRLIVALDVDSLAQAERLAERLDGLVRRFKIGSQLFTAGGLAMVEAAADGAAAAAVELSVRRPLAIAVTVLTSLDRAALHRELGVTSSVEGHVL